MTSVSVRPGVVDTTMQDDIRSKYATNMDEKDQGKFMAAKRDGKLLPPERPGHVIAELAVRATNELSGQFLRYALKSKIVEEYANQHSWTAGMIPNWQTINQIKR